MVQRPVILFGAFDRHNFGDLLFPHIAAALLPDRPLVFAGLAARDLRPYGGHAVQALSQLPLAAGDPPCDLVHVGGEVLTCTAWQAAVMLLPPGEVQATLAWFEARPEARADWVGLQLGTAALAPYTVSRQAHPALARVIFDAVGGTALDQLDPRMRDEVLGKLRAADAVGVRDRRTLAHLAGAGIDAQLLPDPAVMVAELFGGTIRQRAQQGAVAQALRQFPQGYVALHFSADFGDDASLALIVDQLDRVTARHGLGVVLFRAGAAPWHDDLAALGRVAARMRPGSALCFGSIELWDLCALVAHGRAYCGSSLHGRIVAMAFAIPRVNLRPPQGASRAGKQAMYAATWDDAGQPADVAPGMLADSVHAALAADPPRLRHVARHLAAVYRRGFASIMRGAAR